MRGKIIGSCFEITPASREIISPDCVYEIPREINFFNPEKEVKVNRPRGPTRPTYIGRRKGLMSFFIVLLESPVFVGENGGFKTGRGWLLNQIPENATGVFFPNDEIDPDRPYRDSYREPEWIFEKEAE